MGCMPAISLNSLYILKLTRMVALSGTSYSLFSLLSLGSIIPRLLKSMPQDMVAENVLGRPADRLVKSIVTAITGILWLQETLHYIILIFAVTTTF